MNWKELTIIIVSVVLITSSLTFAYYAYTNYYEVKNIPMKVQVDDKAGLNTEKGELDFGIVPDGGISERYAKLSYPKSTVVEISVEGELKDWVKVNKNNIRLDKDETIEVDFILEVPSNTTKGNYTGNAKVYYKKP